MSEEQLWLGGGIVLGCLIAYILSPLLLYWLDEGKHHDLWDKLTRRNNPICPACKSKFIQAECNEDDRWFLCRDCGYTFSVATRR